MTSQPQEQADMQAQLAQVPHFSEQLVQSVRGAVFGKDELVQTALMVLLSGGHLLIEDVPGVGKTALAKALGQAIGGQVRRIQCTPDLLPSDITGSSIFNQSNSTFEFHPGPVFGNVVIADEVNRAEPKAQSALLECMEENQVTADGQTYQLDSPFFVVATQNPSDMQGTFPLPEAQRDRFTARLTMGYPHEEAEQQIVMSNVLAAGATQVQQIASIEQVSAMVQSVKSIHIAPQTAHYITSIVRGTRQHPAVALGASTRSAVQLGRICRARAAMSGRNYVIPDDVKALATITLSHRIMASPQAGDYAGSAEAVIHDVVNNTPVPGNQQ